MGLGYYQRKVSASVNEIFDGSPFAYTATYRVLMLNMEAKYVFLDKNRFSIYGFAGIIGDKSFSITKTTPNFPPGAETNTTKESSSVIPFAFFNFGAGCNYNFCSKYFIRANLDFLYNNNASVMISNSDFSFMPELGVGYRF